MELTDKILWLLKQAFHFSLKTVNDAISSHGVTTAQIGLMRQLANEPGLSGAELARRLLISPQGVQLALTALERRGLVEENRIHNTGASCGPTSPRRVVMSRPPWSTTRSPPTSGY